MGGGLMQLVAYGAQDIYLTGNPQITFFKVVYRRHTNFSMEAIEQTFSGTANFGGKASSTISRNGDLIGRMYLQWRLTGVDDTNDDCCANLGTAIISEVDLEIGGQRIDKHYGHWMEVWSELTESNPSGHAGQYANGTGTVVNGTNYQNMSCSGGVEGRNGALATAADATVTGYFWTPLQFWFCRNPGLALPLIALQYHEVKVITTFETRSRCVTRDAAAATANLDVALWVDYIYLDTDERRRFAQQSHEYLIEQVQFQNEGSSQSMDLNFNHPVKELIWTGGVTVADNDESPTVGPSTPLQLVLGTTYQLKLNGHDRFAARDRNYFTRTQVHAHHSGFGGLTAANATPAALDTVAVYSFALKPEEHQPSGTCNFSRIDNARLELSAADALFIYAVNYNVLRIMSGMGGLAYSN